MKKILKYVVIIIFIGVMFYLSSHISAVDVWSQEEQDTLMKGDGIGPNQGVISKAKKLWATIAVIIQMLSVACVVFAGLRYMFASADAKADIKKQTVGLLIGAFLVFGATSIVRIIGNVSDEALRQGTVQTK